MPNKPKKAMKVPPGFHRMPDGSLMKGKSHGAAKKKAKPQAPAKKAAPRRSATRRNNMDY